MKILVKLLATLASKLWQIKNKVFSRTIHPVARTTFPIYCISLTPSTTLYVRWHYNNLTENVCQHGWLSRLDVLRFHT